MDMIKGGRFVQREDRQPAWHHMLRALLRPGELPSQVIRILGGDYQIDACPLFYHRDGVNHMIESHVAWVRDPLDDETEPYLLQISGPDYEMLQNVQFGTFLDVLVEKAGWTVETAAVLKEGRKVFLAFNVGPDTVNEDEITRYFGAVDYKDGSGGATFFTTVIKMVCENTARAAEEGAADRLVIPHTRGANAEIEWALQAIAYQQRQHERFKAQMEQLGDTPLTSTEEVTHLLAQVYSEPQLTGRLRRIRELQQGSLVELTPELRLEIEQLQSKYDSTRLHLAELRGAAYELYVAGTDVHPRYRYTRYGLYDAISELESHRTGRGSRKVGESLLFGTRAATIQQAAKVLLQA